MADWSTYGIGPPIIRFKKNVDQRDNVTRFTTLVFFIRKLFLVPIDMLEAIRILLRIWGVTCVNDSCFIYHRVSWLPRVFAHGELRLLGAVITGESFSAKIGNRSINFSGPEKPALDNHSQNGLQVTLTKKWLEKFPPVRNFNGWHHKYVRIFDI